MFTLSAVYPVSVTALSSLSAVSVVYCVLLPSVVLVMLAMPGMLCVCLAVNRLYKVWRDALESNTYMSHTTMATLLTL